MNCDQQHEKKVPPVQPALQAHADMLSKSEVIKVTEHVYVAVGYAIANMIMIEGKQAVLIFLSTVVNALRSLTLKKSYNNAKQFKRYSWLLLKVNCQI